MRAVRTALGVLIKIVATNAVVALLGLLFHSPLPLLSSFWQNFAFMLFFLSIFLFAVAGVGGFRKTTGRAPGDKDPSNYKQNTWTGSEGIDTEEPAFLVTGISVLLESMVVALIFT